MLDKLVSQLENFRDLICKAAGNIRFSARIRRFRFRFTRIIFYPNSGSKPRILASGHLSPALGLGSDSNSLPDQTSYINNEFIV